MNPILLLQLRSGHQTFTGGGVAPPPTPFSVLMPGISSLEEVTHVAGIPIEIFGVPVTGSLSSVARIHASGVAAYRSVTGALDQTRDIP